MVISGIIFSAASILTDSVPVCSIIRLMLLPVDILSMPDACLSSETISPKPAASKAEHEVRNNIENKRINIKSKQVYLICIIMKKITVNLLKII